MSHAQPPRPCKSTGCKRPEYVSPKGRRDGHCNPCRLALEKAKDPQAHAFRKFRSNAKARGIFFDLTLAEFRVFCYETDILNGRGIHATSWHIDRIIDALGYTAGNLQMLTNTQNVRKENERRRRAKLVAYVHPSPDNDYNGGLKMIDVTPSENTTAAGWQEPPF